VAKPFVFTAAGPIPEPVATDPGAPVDVRLRTMGELVERTLTAAGVHADQVRAVTVGTPGVVDGDGVIKSCGVITAKDWVGDRLRRRVRNRFPRALVTVDNDANLAVLAEQRFGVADSAEDVVVVLAGRRVGFGIVHGGRLHRGAHHQAGEAANVGGSWWGRASRWLYRHDAETVALFEAARTGQRSAVNSVDEFAELLSMAMAEIVHTIDPELIVLGGAVSLAGDTVLDPVTERFKRACRGMETPAVELSTLGRQSVLLGAAEHARRNAYTHLLDDVLPQLPNATPRRRR
jgi:predicted NBD/HSP70 family sugar kinase